LNKLTVLSLHDLTTNGVRGHVLLHEVLPIGGVKVTLLVPGVEGLLPLTHLLHHLPLNIALHHLILATDTSNTISLALARAILRVVCIEKLLVRLSVDSLVRIVEHLALNGVLEVVVLLWDVGLSHSSKT